VGHRRRATLIAACLAACLLTAVTAGCAGGSSPFQRPSRNVDPPPNVGTVDAKVHPTIDRFGAFEIAVLRPAADGVGALTTSALRNGLYDELIARGYSPLAQTYVDSAGAVTSEPGRTYPMRARITQVLPARDGGYLASGWVGLVSPRADGSEETLYVCEITALAIPPQKGPAVRDGGAETGRRLARALLQHLPAR
jgi:hypothetical protein